MALLGFDSILRIGDVSVAALSRRSLSKSSGAVFGDKRPVAILIRRSQGPIAIYDPDGVAIPLDAFERRHPGRLAEFDRMSLT